MAIKSDGVNGCINEGRPPVDSPDLAMTTTASPIGSTIDESSWSIIAVSSRHSEEGFDAGGSRGSTKRVVTEREFNSPTTCRRIGSESMATSTIIFPVATVPPTSASSRRVITVGTSNQNRLPRPGSLSTRKVPPINSTKSRQMLKPNPVPPCRRVVEASSWVNDSKIV